MSLISRNILSPSVCYVLLQSILKEALEKVLSKNSLKGRSGECNDKIKLQEKNYVQSSSETQTRRILPWTANLVLLLPHSTPCSNVSERPRGRVDVPPQSSRWCLVWRTLKSLCQQPQACFGKVGITVFQELLMCMLQASRVWMEFDCLSVPTGLLTVLGGAQVRIRGGVGVPHVFAWCSTFKYLGMW